MKEAMWIQKLSQAHNEHIIFNNKHYIFYIL